MSAISLDSVSVAYEGSPAVREVFAEIPVGSWVGLIGPNGSGKSTLLKAIVGLVDFEGAISFDGRDVAGFPRGELARTVAYVPQRPLIPEGMTVTDYVLLGRSPHIPHFGVESARDLEIVSDVIDRLELADLVERALGSLSGGELQRVVLARAIAQQAPVVLLDEPTTALDVGHQQQVLELVDALRHDHGLTVISSVHDLTLVGQFADALILLDGGRAAATGSPADVLTETLIREHYGASVRVLLEPDGGIVVIPARVGRAVGVKAT
jgi:iron complex transport system ATP-binding protein